MLIRRGRIAALAAVFSVCASGANSEGPPSWAYPVNPPGAPPPVDDGKVRTLPGSSASFTFADLRNFFSPPDWYPSDHPEMPPLVGHGAKPDAFACGFCHLPSGQGRPENAPIAGLPADYIIKQVREIASGARKSAFPERYPQSLMSKLSPQAATDPGLEAAAAYFASIKRQSRTKVVEASTIPKVENTHWIFKTSNTNETEPIGDRLIEVPDDFEGFEKRDGHVTYTAFVPPGSLARGKSLVETGDDRTVPCATCHGAGLKGLGVAPPLAGGSPSYVLRQLFDFQTRARAGEGAELMTPVVEHLTSADIVAITAYIASLEP